MKIINTYKLQFYPQFRSLNGRDVQTLKLSVGTLRTECDCLWRDCGDCKAPEIPHPFPRYPNPLPKPSSHPYILCGASLKALVVSSLSDPWDHVQQQPAGGKRREDLNTHKFDKI